MIARSRLRFLSAALGLWVLSPASPIVAQEFPEAATVLANMARAERGSAPTHGVETIVAKGECIYELLVGRKPPREPRRGTFAEYLHRSGKAYLFRGYADLGRFEEGSDGNLIWQLDPMSGTTILRGDEEAVTRRMHALTFGEPWQEHYQKATFVRAESVDGVDCYVLAMTPRHGRPETWYVDRNTSLLHGIDFRMKLASWGGVEQEIRTRFSEYRSVGGIQCAFERSSSYDHVKMTWKYESIELDQEIPEARLRLPPVVQEEISRLARQALEGRSEPPAPVARIELETLRPRTTAAIRVTLERSGSSSVSRELGDEVLAALEKSGVAGFGPRYMRVHSMEDDKIDIEVGYMVPAPVSDCGRVKAGELPGGKAATLLHVGNYRGLGVTYRKLKSWIEEQKLETDGPIWQEYLVGRSEERLSSKWRTRLVWPVK